MVDYCKTCFDKYDCDGECAQIRSDAAKFVANLNPSALPQVLFNQWRDLPLASGIYFVLDANQEPIYIGQTQNLLMRWRSNYRRFLHVEVASISYVLVSNRKRWMLLAERELHRRFCPRLDGTHKPLGPKLRDLRAQNA